MRIDELKSKLAKLGISFSNWTPRILDRTNHMIIDDLDDWEPPVCHCGWVHYEGPCQCDLPGCVEARKRDKEAWEEIHERISRGEI